MSERIVYLFPTPGRERGRCYNYILLFISVSTAQLLFERHFLHADHVCSPSRANRISQHCGILAVDALSVYKFERAEKKICEQLV